jgi:hypothetical protein
MSSSKARLSIRFLLCLVRPEGFSLAGNRLVRVLKAPEENADTSSPSFSLGRSSLPWAPSTLSESLIARPEGADRAHGAACAKGAAASTSRGAGINATARSRNVSAKSASGRRRGGRPNTARLPRPKPGTPRQKKRAASEPGPRPRPLTRGRSPCLTPYSWAGTGGRGRRRPARGVPWIGSRAHAEGRRGRRT